jgi:hypothetical protein
MTDDHARSPRHEPPPGGRMLDRPREDGSIAIAAAALAAVIVMGGLFLYGRVETTNTAQLAPQTKSAPSETPMSQQPTQPNPQGTQ